MTILASRIVRAKLTVGAAIGSTPIKDVGTNQTVETYRGNATTFQFTAFDTADAVIDLADVQSVTMRIRASRTYGSTVLAEQTLAAEDLDLTTDSESWADKTKQHMEFIFTNSEMNLDPGAEKKSLWLAVTAFLTDGSEVTLGANTITFWEDNNAAADPPPENLGTAITLEEGDARWVKTEDLTEDGALNPDQPLKTDGDGVLTVGQLVADALKSLGVLVLQSSGGGNYAQIGAPAGMASNKGFTTPLHEGVLSAFSSSSAAPASAPASVGCFHVNTSAKVIYVSAGTASAADWIPFATTLGHPIGWNATQGKFQKITISGAAGHEITSISDL